MAMKGVLACFGTRLPDCSGTFKVRGAKALEDFGVLPAQRLWFLFTARFGVVPVQGASAMVVDGLGVVPAQGV